MPSNGVSELFAFLDSIDEPERVLAACNIVARPSRGNNPWAARHSKRSRLESRSSVLASISDSPKTASPASSRRNMTVSRSPTRSFGWPTTGPAAPSRCGRPPAGGGALRRSGEGGGSARGVGERRSTPGGRLNRVDKTPRAAACAQRTVAGPPSVGITSHAFAEAVSLHERIRGEIKFHDKTLGGERGKLDMSWQEVLQAYRAFQDRAHAPLAASLHDQWANYRTAVRGTQVRRPFHLRILLEELDNGAGRSA